MSSGKRRQSSKQRKYTFARCRECGKMFNCQLDSFIVTAAGDRFCSPCYHSVGWQNLKKPYENYSEGRYAEKVRYRDDE